MTVKKNEITLGIYGSNSISSSASSGVRYARTGINMQNHAAKVPKSVHLLDDTFVLSFSFFMMMLPFVLN